MSDGSRTVAELRAGLSDHDDPDRKDDRNVDAMLADLASRELVNISPGSSHGNVPPMIRIGFAGFPVDFSGTSNFFSTLLAKRVMPWVVAPGLEKTDILFIATCEPVLPEVLVRQPEALRVVVDAGDAYRFAESADVYIGVREPPDDVESHLSLDPRDWLNTDRSAWPGEREAATLLRLILRADQGAAPNVRARKEAVPKLTVGMATYDDFDGAYFTVQALRMFHPEVNDDIEILVVDNNPRSAAGEALRQLSHWIPNLRYVTCGEFNGTAIRDHVFRHARGNAVLCVDSHVLIEPGGLRRLIEYFDAHPGSSDLLQGPMLYDDLASLSTHCDPVWRGGMFGTWGCDPRGLDRDSEPFEIPLQGLGVFACRREAWLGFNPAFRGFGGEEGYIHEKFRQAGRRTLCLPFLRWLHRFARPGGQQYPNLWDDRMRNYLLACEELGLDSDSVEDHFEMHVGPELVDHVRKSWLIERDNPFRFFDAIYCINLDRRADRWEKVSRRFVKLGIDKLVRRFSAIDTVENHHAGCLLSHRAIIEFASRCGLEHVLVLEDDVIFHDATLHYLRRAVAELQKISWRLFYLGGARWGKEYPKAPGCSFLERPDGRGPTTTHAIAYHHSSYDFLLSALPETPDGVREWLTRNAAIDQFLSGVDGRVVVSPVIATQTSLAQYEDELQRPRFTI